MDVLDDNVAAMDRWEVTMLILVDYTKAFDSINSELLLGVLKYMGLGGEELEFFSLLVAATFLRMIVTSICPFLHPTWMMHARGPMKICNACGRCRLSYS